MDQARAEELLRDIFSKEGGLSAQSSSYEERAGQKEMALQVFLAYLHEGVALTEAGTGIGKSLAYLVASMLWASLTKERTVISTHTIALQHQLFEKEIPFLKKALDIEMDVVLVKGMQNYVCLHKLAMDEDRETLLVDRFTDWSRKSGSGCRSTVPFSVTSAEWDLYSADSDSCTRSKCPYFRECFFFKAKKKADEASLIVVNHYLLLTDLADKSDGEKEKERAILPSYKRVIIDEAHHLEDVAYDVFSKVCDWVGLIKLIHRTFSSKSSLDEFTHQKNLLLEKLERSFFLLKNFLSRELKKEETKKNLQPRWLEMEEWSGEIIPAFQDFIHRASHSIKGYREKFSSDKKEEGQVSETVNLLARFEEKMLDLMDFFSAEDRGYVHWIERKEDGNIELSRTLLDVSKKIQEALFSSMRTAALCSATLSSGLNFAFLRKRLGIAARGDVSEAIYPSPFDFSGRTLFLTISNLPDPAEAGFMRGCIEALPNLLKASRGSAFVLFTSNEMLKEVHFALKSHPLLREYTFLKQGDLPRELLIQRFRKEKGSILFGVDSFWEGVDVPGDALKQVIIIKLPFHALQDPLTEALQGQIRLEGGNPFYDYSLPKAIIKFKQGFGRLMRDKEDRGVIVCLDKRLYTKPYGKKILRAVPDGPKTYLTVDETTKKITEFFDEKERELERSGVEPLTSTMPLWRSTN